MDLTHIYNLPIQYSYSAHLTVFIHIVPTFNLDVYLDQSVSEIKLLFCALAGCTFHKTLPPEIDPCALPIYSNNKWLKNRAHTRWTPPKIMHPAVEMCAPGAGCTLNFGHCQCSKLRVHPAPCVQDFDARCTIYMLCTRRVHHFPKYRKTSKLSRTLI